jgi:hypothetical protein
LVICHFDLAARDPERIEDLMAASADHEKASCVMPVFADDDFFAADDREFQGRA